MNEPSVAEQRIILEMGSSNSLYEQNYTKAACRAVQDALRHSSLVFFKSLGYDHSDMRVVVTIGVQEPDKVDCDVVAADLPRGRAEVTVVHGGLNVHDPDNNTTSVIATAAIEAYIPITPNAWRLSSNS
ncbi:MAG: hypothetical protein GX324_00170 [Aeromonadales bacterium]|nr:hypothetical protein [Aeromonadales bacterium]